MKIAIIGAKGMLGRELCRVLGAQHDLLAWDIEEIDITDRLRTIELLAGERPDLIVNSAVFVDLEGCEANPDKAWLINAVGAQNLALAAQQAGSALVYISTDYIFDGRAEMDYDEVAQPNPLNQYGRSKLAGERFSLQLCPRTYAVRTAWLFGHAPNNYVERVLKAADKERIVRMPVDQLESPTYTGHLAEAILHLIATSAYGVYNVTSLGYCTRAGFAQFVLQQAGRTERVEIVESGAVGRRAKRPIRTVLDCRLYQLVTGQPLPQWQQGVKDYLARAVPEK
ncbi:MAG: dTDP-4-dehydrorhamnose reductase [Chloroflexi bacterium]|nr:dTDP-4-dehydrorhamnose reductase [Chloroflexota bacterium]